jgi:hypothetical protein
LNENADFFLPSFFLSFFFFVVLGFELRVSHLRGRCYIIWATPPASDSIFDVWQLLLSIPLSYLSHIWANKIKELL